MWSVRRTWSLPVLVPILFAGCVVLPLQRPNVVAGAAVSKADLRFIEVGVTTRDEIESRLGSPSAWIESRRVLVYEWATERRWIVGVATPAGAAGGTPTALSVHWLFLQTDEQGVILRFTIKKHVQRGERDRILDTWLGRHGTPKRPPAFGTERSPRPPNTDAQEHLRHLEGVLSARLHIDESRI